MKYEIIAIFSKNDFFSSIKVNIYLMNRLLHLQTKYYAAVYNKKVSITWECQKFVFQ